MKVVSSDGERPFAYADPRSLSRAWFDALYARFTSAPAQPNAPRAAAAGSGRLTRAAEHQCAQPLAPGTGPGCVLRPRADEPPRPTLVGVPTAAERSRTYGQRRWPVASATAPPQPPPRLDIARIGATDGSALRLLLDGSRDHVNVVAICDAAHRERVADALLRARIALDARGIALHTRLLESR